MASLVSMIVDFSHIMNAQLRLLRQGKSTLLGAAARPCATFG